MPGQKRRTKGKKTELKSGKQGNDPAFRFSVEDIANMHDSRNQKSRTEKLITGGITFTVLSIIISLFIYFNPSSPEAFTSMAGRVYKQAVSQVGRLRAVLLGSLMEDFLAVEKDILVKLEEMAALREVTEIISYIDFIITYGNSDYIHTSCTYRCALLYI